MGVQSLQSFIEQNCPNACVPVDLLKIARSVCGGPRGNRAAHKGHAQQQQQQRLCLVVDGECCLDRLYGGYFSDWVCGGQWNRMVQFLAVLIQTVQANHMEFAVFFNGGLEPQRMPEWIARQLAERKKINQVLKHVEVKGTPPPKVWWVPPSCLSTCLRMALRHLNISVVCTMDDHHQEVIAYCRENNFHGLMAEDVEYAIFDPPRYFSSEQLKLTYKGSLETKEFILDEVAKGLDLHPNRFCVFAALLGNYLLNEEELAEFYKGLSPDVKGKVPLDVQIKAVCNFVRSLPSVDDLDAIGALVFGPNVPKAAEKIKKFISCVHYYLNGTKGGFLRYWPSNAARKQDSSAQYLPRAGGFAVTGSASASQSSGSGGIALPVDAAKFASETTESELSSLSAYREATGSAISAPQIVVEPPLQTQSDSERSDENSDTAATTPEPRSPVTTNGTTALPPVSPTASGTSSPSNSTSNSLGASRPQTHSRQLPLPVVPPEVMRTTSERQQKGLMSPWIYQVLTQGEIKIPVGLEEEVPSEFPSPTVLYRPIRQMVYAILFNLHHIQFQARQRQEQNKDVPAEKLPDIVVKEWVWSKNNQYGSPEEVHALPLGWAVPTVQRLWFGSTLDDKKRRLRAFLSCMGSDTPLMLNTAFVPQHLLIMCCVLRYMLSRTEVRVLRRQELHAFLAQAVSPRLMDAQSMQSMQLPVITSRGVMLAALFMQGVETALFANDACGAPVPWLMCCPWLFFDGKLFHLKLLRANSDKTLLDICDGHVDQMAKVERIRQAVLQGLKVEFARRPLPPMAPQSRPPPPPHYAPHPCQLIPAGAHMPPHPPLGRPRGPPGRREMLARGGQLEIAGVVVGNWGPNYGSSRGGGGGGGGGSGHNVSGPSGGRGRGVHLAPQVTSVGSVRRFRPTYGSSPSYLAMGQARGYPTYGYRRPPPVRYRRPVTIQAYANKRIKKRPTWKTGKDGENEGSGGVGNAASSAVAARKSVESGCKAENDENVTITVNQLKKSARQQNGGIKDSARERSSSSPTTVCRKQSGSSTDSSNAARNGPSSATAAHCPEDAAAAATADGDGDIKKVAVAKSSAALAVGAGDSK